jgi:hypothetical protein
VATLVARNSAPEEVLDGRLRVESPPGQGTTVRATLPYRTG